MYKDIIFNDLAYNNIDSSFVLPLLEQTVQSGILYDSNIERYYWI